MFSARISKVFKTFIPEVCGVPPVVWICFSRTIELSSELSACWYVNRPSELPLHKGFVPVCLLDSLFTVYLQELFIILDSKLCGLHSLIAFSCLFTL